MKKFKKNNNILSIKEKKTKKSINNHSLQENDKKKNNRNKYKKKNIKVDCKKNTSSDIFNKKDNNMKIQKKKKNTILNTSCKIIKKKNLQTSYKSKENKILVNKNKIKKNNLIFDSKKNHFSNKKKNYKYFLQQKFKKPSFLPVKNVVLNSEVTVFELSKKLAIKSVNILEIMQKLNISGNIDTILNLKEAKLIIEKMGFKAIIKSYTEDLENKILEKKDISNTIIKKKRPPIVTIMGHVDHGKTSLIDYIRSTKIVNKEFGGITQHIGAYHIEFKKEIITFLDTPGHAAFTEMRSRGAQITDIIVLVIAVDDGVMPQTIESIKHAKLSNVPIIVAINKVDKGNSGAVKIKNELSKFGITAEEWGGDTIFVEVSAKYGNGVNDLLEAILLQSEMLELKTCYNCRAKGVVIESYMDLGRGPIATILIQKGVLYKGEIVLSGLEYGKIRGIKNEYGVYIKKSIPSIPVEILGMSGILNVGDEIRVIKNEKIAREITFNRRNDLKALKFTNYTRHKIDDLLLNINIKNLPTLNIILKTDTQGSLEAIKKSLMELSDNKNALVNIISFGIGVISVNDAYLSLTSKSIILGFNVRINSIAKHIIEKENIQTYQYSVIYTLLDNVKLLLKNLLKSKNNKKKIGLVEVKNVFKNSNNSAIAGCIVLKGYIAIKSYIHLIRNDKVIFKGELESLRHFKENVKKINFGFECGVILKNYNNINVGDKISVFKNYKK
ncbi:translation initiation factor IF-2 [Buchnera aphidicola (Mollitrichosiphum nigrofasciatum)]|uniref:translation initiation factor IF-2 n=1 Tax=Buchnera aphidicola TaxID=9 RepID=UPI0031B8A3B3